MYFPDELRNKLQTMGELLRTSQIETKRLINDNEQIQAKYDILKVSSYVGINFTFNSIDCHVHILLLKIVN